MKWVMGTVLDTISDPWSLSLWLSPICSASWRPWIVLWHVLLPWQKPTDHGLKPQKLWAEIKLQVAGMKYFVSAAGELTDKPFDMKSDRNSYQNQVNISWWLKKLRSGINNKTLFKNTYRSIYVLYWNYVDQHLLNGRDIWALERKTNNC